MTPRALAGKAQVSVLFGAFLVRTPNSGEMLDAHLEAAKQPDAARGRALCGVL